MFTTTRGRCMNLRGAARMPVIENVHEPQNILTRSFTMLFKNALCCSYYVYLRANKCLNLFNKMNLNICNIQRFLSWSHTCRGLIGVIFHPIDENFTWSIHPIDVAFIWSTHPINEASTWFIHQSTRPPHGPSIPSTLLSYGPSIPSTTLSHGPPIPSTRPSHGPSISSTRPSHGPSTLSIKPSYGTSTPSTSCLSCGHSTVVTWHIRCVA